VTTFIFGVIFIFQISCVSSFILGGDNWIRKKHWHMVFSIQRLYILCIRSKFVCEVIVFTIYSIKCQSYTTYWLSKAVNM